MADTAREQMESWMSEGIMALKVVVVIVVLLAAVLIFAATRPDTFQIQRSATIQASSDKVFSLINNFHHWPEWSPQDREDSTMKRTYSGADSGVGAITGWQGSGATGKGQAEIVESVPSQKITVRVDWVKPMQLQNINEFVLQPSGSATSVTWSMHGPNLYIMKLMGVFTNMDKTMGKHFEDGLKNLKEVAEK